MPTSNQPKSKHDIIRERRLRQKLERTKTEWTPQGKKDWHKKTRCPLCLQLYVVNNNAQREVRPLRMVGVAVCANCYYKRGTERLVRIYKLGRKMTRVKFDSDVVNIVREVEELFGG